MKAEERINHVALNALPRLVRFIDMQLTKELGTRDHNVVLMIGVSDVCQYAANVPREFGVEMVKDLLARWSIGLEDVLPGEVTTGDTKPFEYLLNAMEHAAQHENPASQGYGSKRAELFAYVGRLVAKANRVPKGGEGA